ncbi:MAG: L-threonylcarbamoyladenylate synthase [Candidatus Dadabacteria bacterium]
MNDSFFLTEVENALRVLNKDGVILYPTDTIWGLGCDATNEKAVERIYRIKQRQDSKSVIILVADESEVLKYVAAPDPSVFDLVKEQDKPTTVIFENAIGLPDKLISDDGTIAIRIVKDEFCRHLIKRLRKPIVSTSANISGQNYPGSFATISDNIKSRVDYIVKWRQEEANPSQPSRIIKVNPNGGLTILRD